MKTARNHSRFSPRSSLQRHKTKRFSRLAANLAADPIGDEHVAVGKKEGKSGGHGGADRDRVERDGKKDGE